MVVPFYRLVYDDTDGGSPYMQYTTVAQFTTGVPFCRASLRKLYVT